MKLLDKPLNAYCSETRVGIALLLVVAVVRFLMLPVFGVPYADGTTYTSMTILVVLLTVYYSYTASQVAGTTYRDILGIAFSLTLSANVMIAVAIGIDDFGGIDTYFTDPAHGGSLNPLLHMSGHILAAFILAVVLWGIGSLLLRFVGRTA